MISGRWRRARVVRPSSGTTARLALRHQAALLTSRTTPASPSAASSPSGMVRPPSRLPSRAAIPRRTGPVSQSTTTEAIPLGRQPFRGCRRIRPAGVAAVGDDDQQRPAGRVAQPLDRQDPSGAQQTCGQRGAAAGRQCRELGGGAFDARGRSQRHDRVGTARRSPKRHQPDLVAPLVGIQQQREDPRSSRPASDRARPSIRWRRRRTAPGSIRGPRAPPRADRRVAAADRRDRRGRGRSDAARRRAGWRSVCSRVSRSPGGRAPTVRPEPAASVRPRRPAGPATPAVGMVSSFARYGAPAETAGRSAGALLRLTRFRRRCGRIVRGGVAAVPARVVVRRRVVARARRRRGRARASPHRCPQIRRSPAGRRAGAGAGAAARAGPRCGRRRR